MWKGALLGGQQKSALKEKVRRDTALAEGGKLKKLLSYIRTSALKADQGKTPEITYLKTLANERQVKVRRSSSASSTCSGSHRSDTTLELGSLEFATEIIFVFFALQFSFHQSKVKHWWRDTRKHVNSFFVFSNVIRHSLQKMFFNQFLHFAKIYFRGPSGFQHRRHHQTAKPRQESSESSTIYEETMALLGFPGCICLGDFWKFLKIYLLKIEESLKYSI